MLTTHANHRTRPLAFTLGALLLAACAAEEPLPPPGPHPAGGVGKADDASRDPDGCVFDPSDPFEPRARVPKGPASGLCYDTRQARPVVHLTAAQAAPYGGLAQDELVVANVFHDGGFWVARIPRDGVETVLFQLEYFPAIVPAGHTQLRVRFRDDRPVVLLGQTAANEGEEVTLQDLVFSVEAIGQPGYQYDVVRGLVDNFGAVYRVTSLAAKLDHMIVKQGHEVEQWELRLEPDELPRLVENYLDESDVRAMDYMYNTLFLNCTNEIIHIIDSAVDYSWNEQVGRFFAKMTEFYPNVIRAALIARGLLPLNQSTDWPPLADDATVQDILDELRR